MSCSLLLSPLNPIHGVLKSRYIPILRRSGARIATDTTGETRETIFAHWRRHIFVFSAPAKIASYSIFASGAETTLLEQETVRTRTSRPVCNEQLHPKHDSFALSPILHHTYRNVHVHGGVIQHGSNRCLAVPVRRPRHTQGLDTAPAESQVADSAHTILPLSDS